MATIPVPTTRSKRPASHEQALTLGEMLGYSNEYLLNLIGLNSQSKSEDPAEDDREYFSDGAGI